MFDKTTHLDSRHTHADWSNSRLHPGMYNLQFAQWDCIMACMLDTLCTRLRQGMHAQKIWQRKQEVVHVMTLKAHRAPTALSLNSKYKHDCHPHQTVVTREPLSMFTLAPWQRLCSSRPQQPNHLPCTSPPLAKTDQELGSLACPQRPRTVLHTAMAHR